MAAGDKHLSIPTAVVVAVSCLLALAVRLPALGSTSLASEEQRAFVESQGGDPWRDLVEGETLSARELSPSSSTWVVARGSRQAPAYTGVLAVWSGVAGTSETALRLLSVLAGVVTVGFVAWAGVFLGGPGTGLIAGGLVALSPLHALASREVGALAFWLAAVLTSLALVLPLGRSGGTGRAVWHGLVAGVLLTGPAAVASVALVQVAWLAARRERRREALVSAAVALVALAAGAGLGLVRSPLAQGAHLEWVPATTASGLGRCAGASFTRVLGLDYHLVVPQARYALPLTLFLLALVVRGARRLGSRWSTLLLAGMLLPFAVGSALALWTGQVTPLQAPRMLPAAPFATLLVASGLGALEGWRAASARVVVFGSTAALLGLALLSPPVETSPSSAVARTIAACRPAGAVVEVERPLDLLALAAWEVPGPLVLKALTGPGPAIHVSPDSVCTREIGPACPDLSGCAAD